MDIHFTIPTPLLYIGGTIITMLIIHLIAHLIYPGN